MCNIIFARKFSNSFFDAFFENFTNHINDGDGCTIIHVKFILVLKKKLN